MKRSHEQTDISEPTINPDFFIISHLRAHRAIMYMGWTQGGWGGGADDGYTTIYGLGKTDKQALADAKKNVGPNHQDALNSNRVKYIELREGESYTIWGGRPIFLHHETDGLK